MKTFASTASRLRTYAAALRAIGVVGLLLSASWLGYVVLRPVPQVTGSPLPAPPTPLFVDDSQRSHWLSVLESRPLRPLIQTPPPVTQAVAVVKPVVAPNIEIVATMVNPGQTPRAFIRSNAAGSNKNGKLTSVEPGGELDGVTIKEIVEGQITVEVQGHEFVIKVGKKPS